MQQNNNRRNNDRQPKAPKEFDEKVIEIKRVTQKTKGGNKMSFSALVVIGDHKGRAGMGFGKAPDVMNAIQKAVRRAKKNLVTLKRNQADSIVHEIYYKYKSAAILLKPAPEGTGVIAGGPIRSVVEAFGVRNLVSKMMGSSNKALNVMATFQALQSMKTQTVMEVKKEEKKEEIKSVPETKTSSKPEAVKKEVKKIAKKPVKTVKKATQKKTK